jgi:hypothetical protein
MVPPPSWLNGDMSNLLTNQVVGKDALGASVLRGAIYDPDSSQTVGGQLAWGPVVRVIAEKERARV